MNDTEKRLSEAIALLEQTKAHTEYRLGDWIERRDAFLSLAPAQKMSPLEPMSDLEAANAAVKQCRAAEAKLSSVTEERDDARRRYYIEAQMRINAEAKLAAVRDVLKGRSSVQAYEVGRALATKGEGEAVSELTARMPEMRIEGVSV